MSDIPAGDKSDPAIPPGARVGFVLLTLALALVAVEAMSFATLRFLTSRGLVYTAPTPPLADYRSYLAGRDPLLGWPAPGSIPGTERDETGSRIVPAFRDPAAHTPCVSLYGDSFTWSSDVGHDAAWGNVLSKRLGCRVQNFGVEGYGTDQAFLRYRQNTADTAPIVILGLQPENILRNVNQYRTLLYANSRFGFKPRFVSDADGTLRRVPLPEIRADELAAFHAHPERYLPTEFFIPGGPSGLERASFPYTATVISTFRHFHVQAKLRSEPWHAAFYHADHPSKALDITAAIIHAFADEAQRRGQQARVLVLPTALDLEHRTESGAWVHAPLLSRIQREDLEVLDLGPSMLVALGDQHRCVLFSAGCNSHYNPAGYALVADLVAEALGAHVTD
jgi:hypothetical protein